jgi:hypothetical protein
VDIRKLKSKYIEISQLEIPEKDKIFRMAISFQELIGYKRFEQNSVFGYEHIAKAGITIIKQLICEKEYPKNPSLFTRLKKAFAVEDALGGDFKLEDLFKISLQDQPKDI